MTTRSVEKSAKTKDAAVAEALRELNLSIEQVTVEILEEEKEGMFGIFGARNARVRVTAKEDKRELSRELLENILKYMNVPCAVKMELDAGDPTRATLLVDGDNVGNVIGKRGATLNALQYLLNVMVNKEGEDKVNVAIDASGYRESRVKSLEELSLKLAARVKETNKSVELEPMTSQERKIIHMTLKNNGDVYTYSKGEEPYRKVVISAKNKERGPKGQGGGRRGPRNENRPPRDENRPPREDRQPRDDNRQPRENRPPRDDNRPPREGRQGDNRPPRDNRDRKSRDRKPEPPRSREMQPSTPNSSISGGISGAARIVQAAKVAAAANPPSVPPVDREKHAENDAEKE